MFFFKSPPSPPIKVDNVWFKMTNTFFVCLIYKWVWNTFLMCCKESINATDIATGRTMTCFHFLFYFLSLASDCFRTLKNKNCDQMEMVPHSHRNWRQHVSIKCCTSVTLQYFFHHRFVHGNLTPRDQFPLKRDSTLVTSHLHACFFCLFGSFRLGEVHDQNGRKNSALSHWFTFWKWTQNSKTDATKETKVRWTPPMSHLNFLCF